ncbi:MAG: ribonuclease P protein component [Muribaculaceae bacterium]|nr:ribonuclease P protein component [Muribaculaceae bacterium]
MLRLYKKQKLCSPTAIGMLFGRQPDTSSALAHPLRAVWRQNPGRKSDAPAQFLISVPKKRLRHAVDRVTMRRRIREAYRLLHQEYPLPDAARIDVAFVYVANVLEPYARVEKAMRRILTAIQQHANAQQ